MKRLNKYFPNCPLNKKLRKLYDMKQVINNSKLEKKLKEQMMKACDNEIHMCWELSYRGVKGYEIRNLKIKTGDKVYCLSDNTNYIVVDVKADTAKVMNVEEETLSNYPLRKIKTDELVLGWRNYHITFKKELAPTFKEVFNFIERMEITSDIEDIKIFNTNKNFITFPEIYHWNSWSDMKKSFFYKSEIKIEEFIHDEDCLFIFFDKTLMNQFEDGR